MSTACKPWRFFGKCFIENVMWKSNKIIDKSVKQLSMGPFNYPTLIQDYRSYCEAFVEERQDRCSERCLMTCHRSSGQLLRQSWDFAKAAQTSSPRRASRTHVTLARKVNFQSKQKLGNMFLRFLCPEIDLFPFYLWMQQRRRAEDSTSSQIYWVHKSWPMKWLLCCVLRNNLLEFSHMKINLTYHLRRAFGRPWKDF